SAPQAPPAVPGGMVAPPPPVSPVLMPDLRTSGGSPGSRSLAQATAAPPIGTTGADRADLALPTDEVPDDLIEAAAPPPAAPQPATASPDQPAGPPTAPTAPGTQVPGTNDRLPPYKFVNDGFIETPPPGQELPPAVK